uniref:Protein phosphatase 6 regulatory subunit 3 n=1 Tax=Ornithorhynchus anatinus TaxID=9258 RepID=A0A6I8P789_ORNAN
MFWKFDLHSSSHIDTLLERDDVTLKALLDEEDVLQECKAQNRKLLDFLLKAECLQDLVSFIVEEPPLSLDEKIRYKYPNISCELLTSDVSQVNDRLGEDEALLVKLYSFLLNEPPLNPLLASFFSKVLSVLISRKPEQIVEFLKKKQDFVDLLIKHIGTSAIMDLLLPPKGAMRTTWGVLDPPVGNTRLNVIRLISSLLQTNSGGVNLELIELNSIGVILDLFFRYTWNNFLHAQVEICIALILASPEDSSTTTPSTTPATQDAPGHHHLLLKHLFLKCHLVERILEAWDLNEKKQADGGRRHGYMGHLTRIANCIVHGSEKGPHSAALQRLLKDLPDQVRERWETFCSSSLGETNKRNTVDLVTTCHIHSSSDDEIDFKESGFSQDSSLQQAFSDYQMQQMTSNFIDQFGFNDEKFADQDDIGNVSFDRVSDINFTLNANETGNMALFEACCKERIQQFDDGGSDEDDIWEEKHVAFAPEAQRRSSSGSTDSEESSAGAEDKMEVDLSEAPAWSATFDVPMETGHGAGLDPWGSGVWSTEEPLPTKETGWASFLGFQPAGSPKEAPRSASPVDMETSTEPPSSSPAPQPSGPTGPGNSVAMDASEGGAEKVTETVMNGSMKETLSLTVDAKTETAVFKRWAGLARASCQAGLRWAGGRAVRRSAPPLPPNTLRLVSAQSVCPPSGHFVYPPVEVCLSLPLSPNGSLHPRHLTPHP